MTTVGSGRPSDRERTGLRGPVKTCIDFMGDDSEPTSETEYAADGRLLVWRGRTFAGSRVEGVYSYDEVGRIISVMSGGSDVTDEFRYDEQGKKTRVRTVPPRPGHENATIGVSIIFEIEQEGFSLRGGGSVITRYNEKDQPIESSVHDADGELLTRIVHGYESGRLVTEALVREAFEVPRQLREQLSEEQRQAFRSQSKEALGRHNSFRNMERSYLYDDEGRVIRRLMRMGNLRQDETFTYNEHGDKGGTVMIQSGSLDPRHRDLDDERSETHHLHQYDNHRNWTKRTTTNSSGIGDPNIHRRTLEYY